MHRIPESLAVLRTVAGTVLLICFIRTSLDRISELEV